MHKSMSALGLMFALLSGSMALADGRDEEADIYLASECYYGVEPKAAEQARLQGVPLEEVPVVLFLASRARVEPVAIVELRKGGRSWMEISRQYSVGAEAYYVPAEAVSGPYETTYAVYRTRPQAEWSVLTLSDADIVNLVGLRFLSEHYGAPAEEVIALRARSDGFLNVHSTLRSRMEMDDVRQVDLAMEPEVEPDYFAETESHFEVTENEVTVVREQGIPESEMPVAFYLAEQAKVPASTIVDLRLRGMTWMEITQRYRMGADIYYVPVEGVSDEVLQRPPYGRAYGHYKKRPREEWNRIVLADDEVVNLVHLRVLRDRYHAAPAQIVIQRSEGKSLGTIYGQVIIEAKGKKSVGHAHGKAKGHGKEKHEKHGKPKKGKKPHGKKDKGHGKGHGKGHD